MREGLKAIGPRYKQRQAAESYEGSGWPAGKLHGYGAFIPFGAGFRVDAPSL
jgi:hypothetical protein